MSDVFRSRRTKLRLVSGFAFLLGGALLSGCGPAIAATVVTLEEQKKQKKKKKKKQDDGTAAVSSGSVRLQWSPPTHRVDGQPLGSDLAGFRLYRGTTSRTYDTVVELSNPLTVEHRFEQLPPGRYFFAVSAYDTNGVESGYSNEADKLVE